MSEMREGPPSDHSHSSPLGPVRRTTTEGPTAKSPRREERGRDQRGGKELPRHQNHSVFFFSDQHSVSETASGKKTEEPTETRIDIREFALRQKPTLNRAWPRERPRAAMCVRNVDDQGVLQFTLIHAVGCVLHRRGSRAIHRLQLFSSFKLVSACEREEGRGKETLSQRERKGRKKK